MRCPCSCIRLQIAVSRSRSAVRCSRRRAAGPRLLDGAPPGRSERPAQRELTVDLQARGTSLAGSEPLVFGMRETHEPGERGVIAARRNTGPARAPRSGKVRLLVEEACPLGLPLVRTCATPWAHLPLGLARGSPCIRQLRLPARDVRFDPRPAIGQFVRAASITAGHGPTVLGAHARQLGSSSRQSRLQMRRAAEQGASLTTFVVEGAPRLCIQSGPRLLLPQTLATPAPLHRWGLAEDPPARPAPCPKSFARGIQHLLHPTRQRPAFLPIPLGPPDVTASV